jgi:N utilization substance protein A
MSEVISAIKQICEEKKLEYGVVIGAIEMALAAAYRKDFGQKNQNVKVKFNPETLHSSIFDVKLVVDDLPPEELAELERQEEEIRLRAELRAKNKAEGIIERYEAPTEEVLEDGEEKHRFNPKTEIQYKDAILVQPNIKVGEELIVELEEPTDYGRMAAQTAKQVIIQKLREVERDMVFTEFKDKEREVITGIVQRQEGRFVIFDLGKSVGILPGEEQIPGENYVTGARFKLFVKEVRSGQRGAEIILSRRSEEILKKIFYLEIPEIANNLVEIKSVAREAGSRSKVAIWSDAENIDPVGSCVGQRGSRIQTIISELGGEKVDIIQYDENPEKYIANALSPAKILSITLVEAERKATVYVPEDKLSLAIGKSGQNVRLAAKLTGWKIDILGAGGVPEETVEEGKVSEENIEEK